ncbi:MAG: hypothetical protein IE916_06120 [Epsilonproteobacteria bacterium]|nr:hypothetical protein [Campylobacterota bacterium]
MDSMIKTARSILLGLGVLASLNATMIIYLAQTHALNAAQIESRKAIVALTQLPDLALSTEATYIRHRSLADYFSIYKDDMALREYFVSSFVISHAKRGEE